MQFVLFCRLAVQNLGRRPRRTLILIMAVAVGAAALFSVHILCQAMQNSLGLGLDRMGADFLIVPRDSRVNLTAALLTVEPNNETFDRPILEKVSLLPCVDRVAPQRYYSFPWPGSEHGLVDLIAFEPERDFTVLPWLQEKLERPLQDGDLIVGGRRGEEIGSEVTLYGQRHVIYGKLSLTAVGPFERSLFTSFKTALAMVESARSVTGREISRDSPDRISGALVRLAKGATPEQFRFAVSRLTGIQVVAGNGLNTAVRMGLFTILGGLAVFSALTLLTTALLIGAIYNGLLGERKQEMGLFLAMGMRPWQLIGLILVEASFTTGLGGILGVLLGSTALVWFRRSLGFALQAHQMHFSLPPLSQMVLTGVVGVLLSSAIGLLGALLPAIGVSTGEPYDLIREEGS